MGHTFGFAALFLLLNILHSANGHGRLLEPPGRSSMWRVGFNTPKNYDDTALYCGGFLNQYSLQGGKCGICGDPYQGPRENEAGGKFATGTISRKYSQGQTIDVTVEVTANHRGWFEFKVCPNNNPKKAATQDCLDRHVLQMADGSGSKLFIGTTQGKINIKLRLPADVTCSQCVLQWRWHTGNSYGVGADGKSCLGCGDQEEFYGCSDVQIDATNGQQPPAVLPTVHVPQTNPGGAQGGVVVPQGNAGVPQGGSFIPQGNAVVPQTNTGVSQGGSMSVPQGNAVVPQTNPGILQGGSVIPQGNVVLPQTNPQAGSNPIVSGGLPQQSTGVGSGFNFVPPGNSAGQTGQGNPSVGQGSAVVGQGSAGVGQGGAAVGQGSAALGQGGPAIGLLKCRAISPMWRGQPELDNWCQYNCLQANNCPRALCACI